MPGKEIDTQALVCQAMRDGKAVFVPYIHRPGDDQSKVIDMLELESLEDLARLGRDAWGIPSLSLNSVSQRRNAVGGLGVTTKANNTNEDIRPSLDLILVPGLAFDRSGGRLGHGKGFYDRYLSRYMVCLQEASDDAKMPALGTDSAPKWPSC